MILVCPPGSADSGAAISHGACAYPPFRPDPIGPWLVDVPPDVAAPLIRFGGFRMRDLMPPPPPQTEAWALVHHPDDPNAVPGAAQPAEDARGHWWVPAARVAALRAHGFVAGVRRPEPSPEPDVPTVAEIEAERDAEKARADAAEKELADLRAAMGAKPAEEPSAGPQPSRPAAARSAPAMTSGGQRQAASAGAAAAAE